MRKMTALISLLALAVFGLRSSAHADVITAEADTFVDSNTPDTNYGSNSQLWTADDSRGIPTTLDRWTILRFDLSTLTSPVASASINLTTAINRAGDYEVYAIADLGADELFDESTYTFNTSAYTTNDRDEDGGINLNDNSLLRSSLTLLGTFSTPATDAYAASFSSASLVSFLNADSNDNAAFIISITTDTGTSTRRFHSSESTTTAYQPQLVTTAIPEPASMAMLSLGGALTLLLRRTAHTKRNV